MFACTALQRCKDTLAGARKVRMPLNISKTVLHAAACKEHQRDCMQGTRTSEAQASNFTGVAALTAAAQHCALHLVST